MVDNFIYSFALDIENGIPIKPYYKGKDDFELEYLMNKLAEIKNEPETTTLVDHVNSRLRLGEFWNYLGSREDQSPQRNERKPTIARKSVVIGQNPQSPQVKQSPKVSPSRSLYANQNSSMRRTHVGQQSPVNNNQS